MCGQENIETHETFGHLAVHFISDIFHFDGMFFSTLKYLLFKPGFLTYEYVRGRRASYLNPIKMYIFISAGIDAYTVDTLEKGCTEEEMMEAVHVAAAIRGGASLVHGVQMMNKVKELSM